MHKLLARQLRRKAGVNGDTQWAEALSELTVSAAQGELTPQAARLVRALPELFGEIESAYGQFDRDLELRRRSLAVSSDELLHLNNQLRSDAASRQRALDALREAADRLLSSRGLPALQASDANLESLSRLMGQLAEEREAALGRLAESEARLVLALKVTDSVAWDWDIGREKLVVISSDDEVLGNPRRRIEENPWLVGELMDREGSARLRETLLEHFRGNTPEFKFGVWMTLKGHDRHYMYLHGRVVERNGEGRALRMAGVMHDLTASKKNEEALRVSEARFRSLTELSSDWYWEQDEQFRFTGTQGASDARAGISADAHVLRTRWELPHTHPVGFTWDEHRAALERHESFRDLIIRREPPGEAVRYVSVSGTPVFSARGKFMGYRGVAKDVTPRVRAEEALRQSQLAAEEATRAKSQFLANMSHEIRTPMNGVLGMTELLLGTPLNTKQRQFAETVRRSGEALLALINDILDFSKIEAGKMDIDCVEFSLREMLDDVAQLLAESAASKGLELVCRMRANVPAVVSGDPTRVRQVLINLIGNAIKFTGQGEVVTEVSMTDDTRGNGRLLCFEVRDTGIGIAREAQEHIFTAFNQADGSTTRHYGGTGLGLAICRQLVALMGGEISLASEPGKGSVFRFTVPCEKASSRQRQQGLPPHAAWLAGKRLLIVDDNAASRDTAREIAESHFEMRCAVAADGIAALRVARQAHARGEPFDVALLDVHMPDLDGIALAGVMRGDPVLAGVRLILAASLEPKGELERARAAGVGAVITKPVFQTELLRALLLAFGVDPSEVSQKLRPAVIAEASSITRFSGHVLVAEDHPVNQQVIRTVLEGFGLQVQMAHNGRAALEAAQRTAFDLIFMDCQMPELDGYMATRAIRALEQDAQPVRHTPVVALTAHATEADRERCLQAGMDGYISKPFTQAILYRELARWLSDDAEQRSSERVAEFTSRTLRLDLRALGELRALDPSASKSMVGNFVNTYVEHTRHALRLLRDAVARGEFAALEHEAHKLRSGSLTIGAARVGKLAGVLERAAEAEDLARCESLLNEIESEFHQAETLLVAETHLPSRAA